MKAQNNTLLTIIVTVILCVVAGYFIFPHLPSNEGIIKRQEEKIKALQRLIIKQDSIQSAEKELQEQEEVKRGVIFLNLKESKRKDSLTQVHTINYLINKYKGKTLEESTKLLLAEYEKAMSDTTTLN